MIKKMQLYLKQNVFKENKAKMQQFTPKAT